MIGCRREEKAGNKSNLKYGVTKAEVSGCKVVKAIK
jgi:hypothetical protein